MADAVARFQEHEIIARMNAGYARMRSDEASWETSSASETSGTERSPTGSSRASARACRRLAGRGASRSTVGREQRGRRPALVISVDGMNQGPVGLAIVVPLTPVSREEIPARVRIEPPEGGVRTTSFAICEQVRTISVERFVERWDA